MKAEMDREEFRRLIEQQGYSLISDEARYVPDLPYECFSRRFGPYAIQIQLHVRAPEPTDEKWAMSAFWHPPGEDLIEFVIGNSTKFSLKSFADAHKTLVSRLTVIARSAQVPKSLGRFAEKASAKK